MVQAMPEWTTTGVFQQLSNLDVPWKDAISASELDLAYYGNLSGGKKVSPLVNRMLDESGVLPDSKLSAIANLIYSTCAVNWTKEYATLSFDYEPIENYDMVETMEQGTTDSYGKTQTRTDDLTHSRSGTDTTSNDLTETVKPEITETQTPNLTSETSDSVYGFNSSAAKGSDERTVKSSGTTTTATTGTSATDSASEIKTVYDTSDKDSGTVSYVDGGSDERSTTHTLKRHGNIGVTTSQQMLQSERDLWLWYYFYDVVFPDVDRVMTLSVY